jgi:hypothetical protein
MDNGTVSRSLHRKENRLNPLFHCPFPAASPLENSRQQRFESRLAGLDDLDFHARSSDRPCFDPLINART